MSKSCVVRTDLRPRRWSKRQSALESLESRRLFSGAMGGPIAHPLVIASPLGGTLADGTSSPTAITPAQFRSAYGIDKIKLNGITGDGSGETIAIVIANDAPHLVSSTSPGFNTSDLHIFDQQFGLPDPPSFTKVEESSGSTAPAPDAAWGLEASLDVEWSHAVAPAAKIVLIEGRDRGDQRFAGLWCEDSGLLSGCFCSFHELWV